MRLIVAVLFCLIISPGFSQKAILLQEKSFETHQKESCLHNDIRKGHLKRLNPYFTTDRSVTSTVQFTWPLQASENYNHPGLYTISNFVDHHSNFEDIQDYNCGERSYDLSNGYNHQGTDIFLWPYGWDLMANGHAQVIAAADGTIVAKLDWNPDENCDFSDPNWNAVYLQHADGSITWYGHLKSGSLISKSIGESVSQGEFLGVVGSSGYSTGPHLHFEVYNPQGELVDPFSGSCNSFNGDTWWENQKEYIDPAVLRVESHGNLPEIGNCKNETTPHFQHFFNPGDSIYLAVYYRDLQSSNLNSYRILDPQGQVYHTWEYNTAQDYYNAAYLTWLMPMPINAQLGIWTYEVTFEGETYTTSYEIVDSPASIDDDWRITNNSIEFNQTITDIEIISLNGKQISCIKNDSFIDLKQFSSGIYVARVSDGKYFSSSKFVIR